MYVFYWIVILFYVDAIVRLADSPKVHFQKDQITLITVNKMD